MFGYNLIRGDKEIGWEDGWGKDWLEEVRVFGEDCRVNICGGETGFTYKK